MTWLRRDGSIGLPSALQLMTVFLRTARTITRAEGAVALAAYVIFIATSIARG